MVAVYIDIDSPYDTTINESYAPFGFYKFGVGCWQYANASNNNGQLYDGAVEWINTPHFTTQPKYANPVGFRYVLFGSTTAKFTTAPTIQAAAPNMFVNGQAYNPTTGLNMPPVFE
jgi:hypothetical protein